MAAPAKIVVGNSKNFPFLSAYRRRPSNAKGAKTRTIFEQAHSDRGRVIFSASFRRLAQKTQVFALSLDGARTRLTHSLEVAHIGAFIVDEIFRRLDKRKTGASVLADWKGLDWQERSAIRTFVEVACLVHDIGNPPFGHFGEKAICNWFRLKKESIGWFRDAIPANRNLEYDFTGFDGNKQGFRILTRLQRNGDDEYGLNLTATQLAATIKYPVLNVEEPSKCSYFQSENSIKREVWKALIQNENDRHPLSLIMEAADDIAYCVSDLEDAAEKGLVTTNDLKSAFGKTIDFSHLSKGITKARTDLTIDLVGRAAELFIARIKNGTLNKPESLLINDASLDRLREVTSKKVYSSRLVLSNEITGYKILQGILDAFIPLLEMEPDDFFKLASAFEKRKSVYTPNLKKIIKNSTAEPSLLSLFPRKHLAVYIEAVSDKAEARLPERFHRLHLMVDFVAGMTDDFALSTYRLLSGQVTYEHR